MQPIMSKRSLEQGVPFLRIFGELEIFGSRELVEELWIGAPFGVDELRV